jgi:type II secretory pathway pseudopilin PulG
MFIDRNALNKMKQKTTAAGFTLVEVLVAAGITSVVLIGVGTGMVSMVRANARAEANSEQRMALNRAQDFITDEARSAQGMWQTRPTWWPSDSTSGGTSATGKLYLQVPLQNVVSVASNRINLPRHGFQNGDAIIFAGTDTGTGLTLSTPTATTPAYRVYYVVDRQDNSFKVASTQGGAELTVNPTSGTLIPSRLVSYFDRDSDSAWLGPKAIHRSTGPCGTTAASQSAQCPMLVDAISSATDSFRATISGRAVSLNLVGQLYDNSMMGGTGETLGVETTARARPVLVAAGGATPSPSTSPSTSPAPSLSPSPSPSPYSSPAPSPSPSPYSSPAPSPSPSPYSSPAPSPSPSPYSSPAPSPSPSPYSSPAPSPSPSPYSSPAPSPSPSPTPPPTQTTNFTSTGGTITLNQPGTISYRILGGDIRCGSSAPAMITTATLNITRPNGTTSSQSTQSNVASTIDVSNLPAGTKITVTGSIPTGRSNPNNTCGANLSFNSAGNYPTTQVVALRNGDTVPNLAPFGGGRSIDAYLSAYMNLTTRKVTIQPNQVIYLFELGTTSSSSSAYDLQDVVVLGTIN